MTRRRARPLATAVVALWSLASCTTGEPLTLPSPPSPDASPVRTEAQPEGTVRVAYADVPATWAGTDGHDSATIDLAALWALPLFRYDDQGQLTPGLVVDVAFPELGDGWAVDLTLADGAWSDGTPVVAADVVATAEALRRVRDREWSAVTRIEGLDQRTVRLVFDEPYGRWAHLLTSPPGVLPAAMVRDGGFGAYDADVPVSGGPFRLEAFEPGRSAAFVAHEAGPLGSPASARVEIDFVPSYETALGLLDRGEVDVVLGHLALNPVARAERLDGVRGDAPLGGTTLSLEWLPDQRLGDDPAARRSVVEAIDLSELVEGLLGPAGEPATSPVPGVEGPLRVATDRGRARSVQIDHEIVLLVPRWHEAVGFTARAVQRDLSAAGGTARLVSVETPALLEPVERHDGRLRIRRDGPRPALGQGDAAPPGPAERLAEELAPAFRELADDALTTPLYRIGVAHAWRERVAGVQPSSWPGLAFWNVADWHLEGTAAG